MTTSITRSLALALAFMTCTTVQLFAQGGEKVSFNTSDNVVIAGTLWNAGAGKPAVICLHQWRSDRSSFTALAQKLSGAGITVLAIDARGYGDSKKNTAGEEVRPDRDIQKDIQAALTYLKGAASPKSFGLIGASYGSSNAVIFAAGSKDITALALLSPGMNYFNVLPTEGPVQKLGSKKVVAFASSEDVRSVEAVKRYAELLGSNITTKIYDNIGHGTDMLGAEKEISSLIKDFFSKHLR